MVLDLMHTVFSLSEGSNAWVRRTTVTASSSEQQKKFYLNLY